MDKEILELLQNMNERLGAIETDIKDLKEGQQRSR